MKIAIGSDHAGFDYKNGVKDHLGNAGHEVVDHGTFSDASCDYPDYAHPVSEYILSNKGSLGILICGSGNGINMTANKHQGVRSALCWNNEIALLARQHNNANIIAIPARFITIEEAITMVDTFLNTSFEGGRHQLRVNKINC
jgi:ribose 5-phosphate isomerase B